MSTDSQENDIELLKYAESPEEFYEMISTFPEIYLPQLETLNECLFNLILRRYDGNLVIKYRMRPEEKWTELGFMGDKYKDEEVYDEFKHHVKLRLMKGPSLVGRQHLVGELQEDDSVQNDQVDDSAQKDRGDDSVQKDDSAQVNNPMEMLEHAKSFVPGSEIRKKQPIDGIREILDGFKTEVVHSLIGDHLCVDSYPLLQLLKNNPQHRDALVTLIVNLQKHYGLLKQLEQILLSSNHIKKYCYDQISHGHQEISLYLDEKSREVIRKYDLDLIDLVYQWLLKHQCVC